MDLNEELTQKDVYDLIVCDESDVCTYWTYTDLFNILSSFYAARFHIDLLTMLDEIWIKSRLGCERVLSRVRSYTEDSLTIELRVSFIAIQARRLTSLIKANREFTRRRSRFANDVCWIPWGSFYSSRLSTSRIYIVARFFSLHHFPLSWNRSKLVRSSLYGNVFFSTCNKSAVIYLPIFIS